MDKIPPDDMDKFIEHMDAKKNPAVIYLRNPASEAFPKKCPPNCSRECERFYQAHGKTLSFALYATHNPEWAPRTICAYAFSCGEEVHGMKFTLKEGETPAQLIKRIVPDLITTLQEMAMYADHETEDYNA